jgi:galactokinase/mevalonate kinase-like predicted kinase
MLQKPTIEKLEELSDTHLFLMDIGIWILSDRAVELLMKRSTDSATGETLCYDLYSEYGLALGRSPIIKDEELNSLSVAILPLPGGEFYHYGTSRELITSTLAVQQKVRDQRVIMHKRVKPSPAIFVQNALTEIPLRIENEQVWVENSHIAAGWSLGSHQIVTGVPRNDWSLSLPDGVCVDVVPIGERAFAARPYGINDVFKGALDAESTLFLGKPFAEWLSERGLSLSDISGRHDDLQAAALFPLTESVDELGILLRWMISSPELAEGKRLWLGARRLSADELSAQANLARLYRQREEFRRENWKGLARNYQRSIFYQLDLDDAAREMTEMGLEVPAALPDNEPQLLQMHNHMLRSRMLASTDAEASRREEAQAFEWLRSGLIGEVCGQKYDPKLNVFADQIVWSRSPVRIDLAGGWTDTPPYSLYAGGNVVNIAIELNGQPPLQVYIKPCAEPHIVLRSIDMGAREVVTTYAELQDYKKIGSPFSIPKAALSLAGFAPAFCSRSYDSLRSQLESFGSGLEVTLLAAIPAGSGLGTSSILASTVLGAINDFCALAWDKNDICRYTLILEQMLTTGGGWQDQYGGVFSGVKLLQTDSGFMQTPSVRWLPEHLFTATDYRDCHLLYYTGITRVAKGILGEIVRSVFLNSQKHLSLLADMKAHALDMNEAIQRGDFAEYARLINKTWSQNKALDSGTNPPPVEAIIDMVKDYTAGLKLPGAGGGGYLYMVAKDPQAAAMIRRTLTENPPNSRARFVDMALSDKGLQVSRS